MDKDERRNELHKKKEKIGKMTSFVVSNVSVFLKENQEDKKKEVMGNHQEISSFIGEYVTTHSEVVQTTRIW